MCEELDVQARLKKIDDGFDDENYYDGGCCDVCGGERRYYTNKYSDAYQVWACADCFDGWQTETFPEQGENVCPICGEFVRYDGGDCDEHNYAICGEDGCGQKIHINCLADEVENDDILDLIKLYKIWYCDQHRNRTKIFRELRRVGTPEFRLYRVLKKIGMEYIYHANTVRTSCTLLAKKGLLSRGAVELIGGDQTPQKSDEDDKKLGIWYDIFFDNVDIHLHLSQCTNQSACINLYGPVLFKYRLEALLDLDILRNIKITRTNPIDWFRNNNGNTDFFSDIDEIERNYRKGNFQQHLVIGNQRGNFPFRHLEAMVIDDPGQRDQFGVDIYSQAVGALRSAQRRGRLSNIRFTRRTCVARCSCAITYASMYNGNRDKFDELFAP